MIYRLLDIQEFDDGLLEDLKSRRIAYKKVSDKAVIFRILYTISGGPVDLNKMFELALREFLVEEVFKLKTKVNFVDFQTQETTHKLIRSQRREPNKNTKLGSWKFVNLVGIVEGLKIMNINYLYLEWIKLKEKHRKRKEDKNFIKGVKGYGKQK